MAESSNLEPPQSSNITPALDAQDSFSQCTQGTNDFDLQNILESLTHSAVHNSSALPVQSPTAHLPSSSSTLTLQSLQQPCISLLSMSFPPTTVSLPASSVSQANSQGQLVLGTGVNFNIRPLSVLQSLPVVSNIGSPTPGRTANRNSIPFTLKLRTKQIKICQSCRKDYEGENDTLGLVVAHPERKWISNPVTGAQFWGKESNSHYHAHVMCLKKAESSFEIEIPKELIPKLTIFQKVYLMTCLNVPPMKLDLEV